MANQEWPANEYAIGSFIQATIGETYLDRLDMKPTDKVMDLGCGDGGFTRNLLEKVPQGSVLGVDASANMLALAKNLCHDYPNFALKQADVLSMDFHSQFDYIVSFWCLQWVQDIQKAFTNILSALKPGGKVLAIFPTGDDPFMSGYHAVKNSGEFPSLSQFIPPVDYDRLSNLPDKLNTIPNSHLLVRKCPHSLVLPSLDAYRKFVNGIAFYQGQVPAQEIPLINEAMVKYFEMTCKKHYQGAWRFDLTIYLVTGEN
jgi:ubiquinone/menaquinone biosynthesis C-methylase UbiE